MPAKPQPPYARLNQPLRSPNGKHRRSNPKNHSDPLDGAGTSAGGADADVAEQLARIDALLTPPPIPGGVTYLDPGVSAVDWVALNQYIQQDMTATMRQMMLYGTNAYMVKAAEPPPIPYTGLHSGEITGYRAWLVTNAYDLCSLAHYFVWEPGKTIEGDVEKVVWDGMGMNPNRYGGVYAYSSFDQLRDDELVNVAKNKHRFPYLEDISPKSLSFWDTIKLSDYTANCVIYLGYAYGTVKLWGETVEHVKGYRASFAKLTSIDGFIGVDGFDLDRLREKYLV